MQLDDFCFDGKGTFSLDDYPTNAKIPKAQRERYEALMQENIDRMADLQDRLYAEGREGVVIMFQAMDAAGKDSTIKRVMTGLNPQGVNVYSFKQPTHEELAHDFLWRAVTHLPRRGYIGLFNRSYYEDVLVVRVHQMQHNYAMPKRTTDMSEAEFFSHRHRQIRDFERYLWENGYRLVKIMLNVSEKEQAKRFLERIDNPAKNWKFSSSDLAERALWPKYRAAFTEVIGETATPEAPWYVIPADQKWFARYLVSEAVVRVLTECDPQYPKLAEDQLDKLAEYRRQLTAE
jgi:PPK2 family polyphosphate:nucleotide phosphotransferase